jgi:hypothetical protein
MGWRWSLGIVMALTATVVVGPAAPRAQQNAPEEEDMMLTYTRGQPVVPAYHGWTPKPDGTVDLWFGYLNRNYREELDVPIGPNNLVSGSFGPDAGQPTHFLPRNNRWIFKVNVKRDFPDKEVVWTVISKGKTYRAYATLNPAYVKDIHGMQREYFGLIPPENNAPPDIRIEGGPTRNVNVGEPATLRVMATDDGAEAPAAPPGSATGRGATPGAARTGGGPAGVGALLGGRGPSICGANRTPFFCGEPAESGMQLLSLKGLRTSCFLYRGGPDRGAAGDFGNASLVTFDPPQAKVWEDHLGGSPWAAGYRLPPVPNDNTWVIKTSFKEPGTYVVRCQAHDGYLVSTADVTFTVTR